MRFPTMLVVLDGFGYSVESHGNAVIHAQMPFWNTLCARYPLRLLHASGEHVGLRHGFIGNSEVGHLTLGAGRVVQSPLKRIHDAIDNGLLSRNKILIESFLRIKEADTALHLVGLLSDAGVHSHEYHLRALLRLAHEAGLKKIFIHAILDGRDVPPMSAHGYIEQLESVCGQLGCGVIASIHGRFYAMDRDENWQRTQASYDVLCGAGKPATWHDALARSYANAVTDEFFSPQLLRSDGAVRPGDGMLFFNFRPDRACQLTEAFINPAFKHFPNPINTGNKSLAFFITMMRNKDDFVLFNNDTLFGREYVEQTLLDVIADCSVAGNDVNNHDGASGVFIIAETEKYAHVTYFFRGMNEKQLAHEMRVLIPSIKAKNYIEHPEMSAPSITSALIRSLRSTPAYFYLVNYANADMVGHSGDFAATVKACEVLDQQLAILYHEVVERRSGTLIITADHGNAEQKIDAHGNGLTAHTTNPVPFVVVSKAHKIKGKAGAVAAPTFGLAHVAPTIIKMLGLPIPSVMEQETLL